MRNRLDFLCLLISFALVGVGCTSSLEQFNAEHLQTLLQINGSISGAFTRAHNAQWEGGDAIGVSITGTDLKVENVRYVTQQADGVFTPSEGPIRLPVHSTVKAYYPYGEVSDHQYYIDLSEQTKQSSIDFMTAQSEVSEGQSFANLRFSHRLSKLVVEIEGVTGDQNVGVLLGQQKVNLTYNLQDDRLTVSDKQQSVLFARVDNKAEAILVPNTLEGNPAVDRRLTITVDGNSYSAAILSITSFQPGYRYTYKFRLNDNKTATITGTDVTDWELVTGEEIGNVHTFKRAPLYWSIYEYCWLIEGNVPDYQKNMTEEQWIEVADWVQTELLPYGYNMLCTDGFIPMLSLHEPYGYMDTYGKVELKRLVEICRERGLKLGVYDNPLWLHGNDNTPIPNTNFVQQDLKYDPNKDEVKYPNPPNGEMFTYLVATHPGAREYIDAFFKYYKELGVDYIRMDFLSWYEDGYDRGMKIVGRGYGRECYELALKYIAQAAKKYGIFTSLVMPHLYNSAELERKYGNMVRIVADTGNGGWYHCSDAERGTVYENWPNCMNMYDGFAYWSKVSGRNDLILDGDFIRLNTFATDDEKRAVISLQLMAGGPIAVADQPSTIGGHNLQFYTNREVLALNYDGFVGKPLDVTLVDSNYFYSDGKIKKHQIWYGQMSNGDWIVCIFNREGASEDRYVDLKWFGLENSWNIRDLWTGEKAYDWKIEAKVPAHGCKLVRISQ